MKESDSSEWKLVTDFSLAAYKCGLEPGDTVSIKKEVPLQNGDGEITGKYDIGRKARIIAGSPQSPNVLWCRWLDTNELFTWDDDAEFFEWFEKVDEGPD